jgi:hypothetical protein
METSEFCCHIFPEIVRCSMEVGTEDGDGRNWLRDYISLIHIRILIERND